MCMLSILVCAHDSYIFLYFISFSLTFNFSQVNLIDFANVFAVAVPLYESVHTVIYTLYHTYEYKIISEFLKPTTANTFEMSKCIIFWNGEKIEHTSLWDYQYVFFQ